MQLVKLIQIRKYIPNTVIYETVEFRTTLPSQERREKSLQNEVYEKKKKP